MTDMLAIMTMMFWPVIPLFWIPVHIFPAFFRRIGLFTYGMPFITWIPVASIIYVKRSYLIQAKVNLFPASWIIGILLLSAGTILHLWTARLLGLRGIIGIPEISQKVKKSLVTGGPYTVVRHPTYLAHTLLFTGVFLITGVLSIAVLTSVDFLMVNAVIIPFEERELQNRFGDEYRRYREKVPFCFLPWIF